MDEATLPYADDPARQLVAMVRAVARQVAAPDYRGCPFRTTHAQFRDEDHPANRVAVRHVEKLRSRLHASARRAGASDARALADRLMLIIDGLYVNASMLGRTSALSAGVGLADQLVRESIEPASPSKAASS